MLNIETKSKLSPEEAVKRAVKFFGPEGYGLKVKEEAPCCVEFEGGGGGVAVSASAQGKGSRVDIESREWDYQVKEFIQKIK
jgi:hypothetical protein